MPIRPENRARYPRDWKAISAAARARAGNCCEFCGLDNGAFVERPGERLVRIVLTVAHLDHTPENCDPANLRALCQRCHLRYDHTHHIANARATRRNRKADGDLWPDAPPSPTAKQDTKTPV